MKITQEVVNRLKKLALQDTSLEILEQYGEDFDFNMDDFSIGQEDGRTYLARELCFLLSIDYNNEIQELQ